jgi:hypothetical protein
MSKHTLISGVIATLILEGGYDVMVLIILTDNVIATLILEGGYDVSPIVFSDIARIDGFHCHYCSFLA